MIHSFLAPTFIIGILCYFFYKLFALYARRKERILFIEKMKDFNLSSPCIFPQLPEYSSGNNKFVPLHIALTLSGMGFGLILGFLLSSYGLDPLSPLSSNKDREIIYTASMLFFGGLGLLISFILEYKVFSKSKHNSSESK